MSKHNKCVLLYVYKTQNIGTDNMVKIICSHIKMLCPVSIPYTSVLVSVFVSVPAYIFTRRRLIFFLEKVLCFKRRRSPICTEGLLLLMLKQSKGEYNSVATYKNVVISKVRRKKTIQ